MTAHRIEAVLFDLAGTLTAADPAPDVLNLLPQALPSLQQLAKRTLPTGLLPDQHQRDYTQLKPTAITCLQSAETLRPYPAPDRVAMLAIQMGVYALRRCVLVCGSPEAVSAGLNAGVWTVGTALSGALSAEDMARLGDQDSGTRDRLRLQATMALMNAGAHYVIDSVDELGSCLDDIEARQAKAALA